MKPYAAISLLLSVLFAPAARPATPDAERPIPRLIIFKIDGLNGDLLYQAMQQIDPETGKSCLPWFAHIFGDNGTIFQNFYTRGVSLSAPSWSMLDTGHHGIIRGNVEYDRFTGYVYDYLNFFPFYISYARSRRVDMAGVEELDRAGVPLIIDSYTYPQVLQSFQLYQRGVRWESLKDTLVRRFSSRNLLSLIENPGNLDFRQLFYQQMQQELRSGLQQRQILYLDFYSGEIDHDAHAINNRAALLEVLKHLDAFAGRIWTGIQASPYRANTVFVVVSDHGMNNVPGIFSQGYNLPAFLNSSDGGAHHVITNRHQLSDYRIAGLNPLVKRVTNPSTASFYLKGKEDEYPTAWLDLDGNERASVHLRSSDFNKIHILLLQLADQHLAPDLRKAAAGSLRATIDRHRTDWTRLCSDLEEEMAALAQAIERRRELVSHRPRKRRGYTAEQLRLGEDKETRRLLAELDAWQNEHSAYTSYLTHLRALLALEPDCIHPFRGKVEDLVPPLALGDSNSVRDLQNYVAGPAPGGLVLNQNGSLDQERSFRYVNYFPLLVSQHVRNNPQPALSNHPVDFIDMRLPDGIYSSDVQTLQHAYWLYGDEDSQIIILTDPQNRIKVIPVRHLTEDASGAIQYDSGPWRAGLPLRLLEDPQLRLPRGVTDRVLWLSAWHTEREWLEAVHLCRYSNGVIGVTEQLSPVADNIPGPPGISPLMLRFERRRRALVQADFHLFAADHWNFNARDFNPGGNHGSFLRISTHSVWMMAGPGVPAHRLIDAPYDTLNFASTVLSLAGKTPPMPDRVVKLSP
ncbi:MAG TPA: alkaline phosphatase family protein [Verrucomicrobiae bacterium]|nr:alkaline phosphatase family protein [Verrucomicrobiae bacterium]